MWGFFSADLLILFSRSRIKRESAAGIFLLHHHPTNRIVQIKPSTRGRNNTLGQSRIWTNPATRRKPTNQDAVGAQLTRARPCTSTSFTLAAQRAE